MFHHLQKGSSSNGKNVDDGTDERQNTSPSTLSHPGIPSAHNNQSWYRMHAQPRRHAHDVRARMTEQSAADPAVLLPGREEGGVDPRPHPTTAPAAPALAACAAGARRSAVGAGCCGRGERLRLARRAEAPGHLPLGAAAREVEFGDGEMTAEVRSESSVRTVESPPSALLLRLKSRNESVSSDMAGCCWGSMVD